MKMGSTKIIRIGNSRGARLPKTVLDRSNLTDKVSVEARDGVVILRRENERRAGWDAQFREMAASGGDAPLMDGIPTEWDENEWQW